MKERELSINVLRKNRAALAMLAASLFLAACGSKVKAEEVSPGEAQSKTMPTEVQPKPKPVTNSETESLETNKSQEIEGSPEGFPLEVEVSHKGGNEYDLLVKNTSEVAASAFKITVTSLNKDLAPIVMDEGWFDGDGHDITVFKAETPEPEPVGYSEMYSIIPGLEAGDILKIEAEIPGAERIYMAVDPSDQSIAELRRSDVVYDASPTGS